MDSNLKVQYLLYNFIVNYLLLFRVEPTAMPDNLESNANMRLEASWTDTAHKDGDSNPKNFGFAESIRAFFNVIQIERVTVTMSSVTFLPSTTKTIFIMRCTPRPFTISICSRGPRGPRQELDWKKDKILFISSSPSIILTIYLKWQLNCA